MRTLTLGAALVLALLCPLARAAGAPETITPEVWCSDCGKQKDDYTRYMIVAVNCVLWADGPDFSQNYWKRPCTDGPPPKYGARERFRDQVDRRVPPSGIKIKVYTNLVNPPESMYVVIKPVFGDPEGIISLPWYGNVPINSRLKTIEVSATSSDGTPHKLIYEADTIEAPFYTSPPNGPDYPPGHPYHGHGGGGCARPMDNGNMTALNSDGSQVELGPTSGVIQQYPSGGFWLSIDQVQRVGNERLIITHAPEHAQNERFAPKPRVLLAPVRFDGEASGWAIVRLSAEGAVLESRVEPISGPVPTAEAVANLSLLWQDARRHDVSVYYAYAARDGYLEMRNAPLVVEPECCHNGCCK